MLRLILAAVLSAVVAGATDVGIVSPSTASWCGLISGLLTTWYLLRPLYASTPAATPAATTAPALPRRPRADQSGLYAKRYELLAADLVHARSNGSQQNVTERAS